jgi:protoporphyrinogen oxidase
LPSAERARCLEGLIQAALNKSDRPLADFEDFILRTFGRGIAEVFMLPYNFKVWGYPPARLGAEWIGERVSVPDPSRAARNVAQGADDVSWGPNSTFRFPRHGGTGAICEALARRLPAEKILVGSAAVEIDVAARRVVFDDGTQEQYDQLISTIPLDQFAHLAHHQDWIESASRLAHSSTYVVGVGLQGQAPAELASKCWMYFPEANSPFYRVTHFSLYSPNNVDDIARHWSLMAEVSESPDKPVDRTNVVKDTIAGLVATGLIDSPARVAHTWMLRVEYGYPTPTPQRDEILHNLLPKMYEQGILSRGRFGAWKYEVANQDHSFMQGYEAAAHILFGCPELTVWDAGFVNARHRVLGWDRWKLPLPLLSSDVSQRGIQPAAERRMRAA